MLLAQRRFFNCACRKTALFIRNSNGLVLQIGDEQNKPVSKTSVQRPPSGLEVVMLFCPPERASPRTPVTVATVVLWPSSEAVVVVKAR